MISSELVAKVKLYFEVAKVNGSLLSLSDLSKVLPEQRSEAELARTIMSSPELDAIYDLKSGFLVEKSDTDDDASNERDSRLRAMSNLTRALRFAPLLDGPEVRLIGISGSTSYESASKSHDIDFFCVTSRDALWIFLTRALIVSRLLHFLKRDSPEICLSCTIDADYAEEAFARSRDPLIARDALSMIVVSGKDFYRRLLERGSWISEFYPRLYSTRLGDGRTDERIISEPKITKRIVNRFLFHTAGSYIRVKSMLHNRRLTKQGRDDATFTLLIGEDRCVYESVRYTNLRKMYGLLRVK